MFVPTTISQSDLEISFFHEQLDSAKILGTCLVDLNNMSDKEQFCIGDVELKVAGYPSVNRLLLVLLLHGCK